MKLARVLGELVTRLDAHGVAYAVVGGFAASAHGEARFTRDIDVAIRVDNDEQAEQCISRLVQEGYVVIATVEQEVTNRLATARLRHSNGVVCDLIFATSGIESEVVATAQQLELFPGQWISTATAESMVAMKILSATAKRPRDLGDLQAMLRENPTLDESRVASLLDTMTKRGYSRGQDLPERGRHTSWHTFIKSHLGAIGSADFFTVEVLRDGLISLARVFVPYGVRRQSHCSV